MLKLILNIYIHIAAALLYSSIIIICRTLRIEIKGRKPFDKLKKAKKPVIFAVWHQATFVMFYIYRGLGAYIFVTSEVRGQVLGKCAEWLGFKTLPIFLEKKITAARSTARVLKYLKKGHDVVVAVDGPKGPLFEVKPGVFFLSKRSKVSIIPVGIKAPWKLTLFWRWDKYFIPLPFSRVRVNLGKSILPHEIKKINLQKTLKKLSG